METELIPPKGRKSSNNEVSLVQIIVQLIIGIVLVTNSSSFVTTIFQLLGVALIIYGIYKGIQYISLKQQFHKEDTNALTSAIFAIGIGLLIVTLSGILEIGLRYIIGIILITYGIRYLYLQKIFNTLTFNFSNIELIKAIIFIALGIYSILFANVALIIVGVFLIISSIYDLVNYFKK